MAKSDARGLFYKLIWITVLVLALVLSVLGSCSMSSIGLEQKARCGMAEHVHTGDCYLDAMLTCDRKAHTHEEDCYLLLLRDNNINTLLEALENAEGQSLERILSLVVTQNMGENHRLTAEEIENLNAVLQQDQTYPSLLLNRKLNGGITLEDLSGGNGGATTLALPAEPSTGNDAVNYYIYVADAGNTRYVLVNRGTVTYYRYNDWYGYYYDTYDDVKSAYQSEWVVSSIANNNINGTYFFRYNQNGNTSSFGNNAGYQSGNTVTFGSTNAARYVLMTNRTGSYYNYSYPPVNFYTVTLDYSQSGETKENTVQYVESNLSSTLSLSNTYLWYDSVTDTTPGSTLPARITEKTTLYARLPRTVTFNSNGGSAVSSQTVGNGLKAVKPADPVYGDEEFLGWYTDEAGTMAFDFDTAIEGDITLYAKWKPKNIQAKFYSNGTLHTTQTLELTGGTVNQPSDPAPRTGYTFGGWCTDNGCTDPNCSKKVTFPVTITQNTNYYAIWTLNQYTLNRVYLNANGELVNTKTTTVNHGSTVTLDEHYSWTDDKGNAYTGGSSVTITGDVTFTGTIHSYNVSITDENGVTSVSRVGHGDSVTLHALPEGYFWVDGNGTVYSPGDVNITSDMTFTASSKTLELNYRVNFPSNTGYTSPTIYGTNVTTLTDVIRGGLPATVKGLTTRILGSKSTLYFFHGWTIQGTDVVVPVGTQLRWEELEKYADANGEINLVGKWETNNGYNSASFYVRFDSKAVDTEGNITGQDTTLYTPEIFHTYVGGVDTNLGGDRIKELYEIADKTADNSYTADQEIRALHGEKASGVWMYDFPKDDDVFAYLKSYMASHTDKVLSVDEVPVDLDELDSKHYAIRWYVFKKENDNWHVDGRLVRREGHITVSKLFDGVEDAVKLAEKDFYILAENGTRNAAGEFVPNDPTAKGFKQYILVLDHSRDAELREAYPNATIKVVDADLSNPANHFYRWKITDVLLGEYWRVTEFPAEDDGLKSYSYYAEYSIYDTDGGFSAVADYGVQASIVGKTFALDEDPDQGMMVDFKNYYYDPNSILLKKEDGMTGAGLAGAQFQIWQKGMPLKFAYDKATGIYAQDPDAEQLPPDDPNYRDLTIITTNESGFAILTQFSYVHDSENGEITIKEVLPPTGYDPAYDVVLAQRDGSVVVSRVEGIDDPDKFSKYAEVHVDYFNTEDDDPDNPSTLENNITMEVAVVKDYTSQQLSVTAQKIWNTDTPANSVDVVLQANGGNAAALLPGLTNAQVVLNEANGWTYTWTELPRYVNGQLVTWGIKEVKVGADATLQDGSSFANWITTYSPGVGTDTDRDGDVDNWRYTVTNTIRRPMLILTKVDAHGQALAGATFTFEQVTWKGGVWQTVSGTTPLTLTTDATGMLTFDNLSTNAYYRLRETDAPEGYFSLFDSIVLSVNGIGEIKQVQSDGTLTDVSGGIEVTAPYNVKVMNLKVESLPETGGTGKTIYTQSGLLLMLAAAGLYIYNNLRRKEDAYSP